MVKYGLLIIHASSSSELSPRVAKRFVGFEAATGVGFFSLDTGAAPPGAPSVPAAAYTRHIIQIDRGVAFSNGHTCKLKKSAQ